MITNGYLLVAERIQRLNRAGLEWLQISIDNVTPDDVSKKSLKVLDKKLQLLAEYADFHVNINSVVGGGVKQSAGCAHHRPPRAGAGLQIDHRHHSRWRRPTPAAERRRTRGLSRNEVDGEAQLHARERIPGQHRPGTPEPMALPRRRALSLYLRRRSGALLLAAARLSRQCRSRTIPTPTSGANTSPRRHARRTAPSHACTRFQSSIPGARHSSLRRLR